jgi:hypothetical protein
MGDIHFTDYLGPNQRPGSKVTATNAFLQPLPKTQHVSNSIEELLQ